MRHPSGRMMPHQVLVTHNIFGTDVDGGRKIVGTRPVKNVPAFVQPGKSRTIVETADETGYRRVTETNPTRIYFVSDQSLEVQDMISWVDSLSVTHNYIVTGYSEPGGLTSFWMADCDEVI